MSTKIIDVERWNLNWKKYKNYLGTKWLYFKESHDVADQIAYLDYEEEIDYNFPDHEVIRKGRNLFSEK